MAGEPGQDGPGGRVEAFADYTAQRAKEYEEMSKASEEEMKRSVANIVKNPFYKK